MAFDFLEPISNELIDFINTLPPQSLGKKVVFHTESDFPVLKNASIAIFGVLDNRGLQNNKAVDLSEIRKAFYSLYPGNWHSELIDLGDIPQGNEQEDTYYAVTAICTQLIKQQVFPIVLGGSQDITYAMYRAFDQLDQMVNIVSVDSRFDLGNDEVKHTANSYLSKIIVNEPNNLFNFSNVGYQTYYNSQEEIDLVEKLFFDAYRLGDVSTAISIAEPVFRDADLVTFDLTSVKSADSGNILTFVPNGFNGKEICSLSRYAGISDKVKCFGLFNHNGTVQESMLIAQVIWYFVEGFNFRTVENPSVNANNYLRYIVPVDDMELIFIKSSKTERWWIEIPFISNVNNKLKRITLLPCSYDDYLRACDQELPERWWKAQRKMVL
jgi:arginase family enzyme